MFQYILMIAILGIIVLGYQVKKSGSRGGSGSRRRGYHSESERIQHVTGSHAKQVANVEKERARQNVRHEGGYYPG
ncbi:MAG: hypothetical protein ACTSUZ_03705 [Candidatus Thorarchaeota archaeon]